MKTILLLLLMMGFLNSTAQLRHPAPSYNATPLVEKQKAQQARVVTMIAVNLAIFAVQEYAIHNGHTELRRACTATYFAANAMGAAWVLSMDTTTDKRRLKARFRWPWQ